MKKVIVTKGKIHDNMDESNTHKLIEANAVKLLPIIETSVKGYLAREVLSRTTALSDRLASSFPRRTLATVLHQTPIYC